MVDSSLISVSKFFAEASIWGRKLTSPELRGLLILNLVPLLVIVIGGLILLLTPPLEEEKSPERLRLEALVRERIRLAPEQPLADGIEKDTIQREMEEAEILQFLFTVPFGKEITLSAIESESLLLRLSSNELLRQWKNTDRATLFLLGYSEPNTYLDQTARSLDRARATQQVILEMRQQSQSSWAVYPIQMGAVEISLLDSPSTQNAVEVWFLLRRQGAPL
ncbi:MAG: hypothetical protein AAGJ31_15765 [Verrucomicrobiota bacterium]